MVKKPENVFVIIPAYNEGSRLGGVLANLKNEGFTRLIVVDDGSTDNTHEVARNAGAVLISHHINRGPGAATQTGLEYARLCHAKLAATIDADGQHNPKDLHTLIEKITQSRLDVVFGSRFLGKGNHIPVLKRIFNRIADLITFILSTQWVSDSQTGLKVFSHTALEKIVINTDGFEFCTEIFMQIRQHKLKYCEVPITVNYEAGSQAKGQNLATGISTLFKLFLEAITK